MHSGMAGRIDPIYGMHMPFRSDAPTICND